MNAFRLARRAGVVAVMALAAIELHELGHLLAYSVAAYTARVTFQRVDPLVAVSDQVQIWAKAAGPVASLTAAAVLLWLARRRTGSSTPSR